MVDISADDIQRRQALNAERNPRREIPNEATQKLNPLTGKTYDDLALWLELESHEMWDNFYAIYSENKNSYFPGKEPIMKPTTTDFIEYQFALARMDVKDGKMHPAEYKAVRASVSELVKRLNEANVPLTVLSSPDGLDNVLNAMVKEEILKYQVSAYFKNPYDEHIEILTKPSKFYH